MSKCQATAIKLPSIPTSPSCLGSRRPSGTPKSWRSPGIATCKAFYAWSSWAWTARPSRSMAEPDHFVPGECVPFHRGAVGIDAQADGRGGEGPPEVGVPRRTTTTSSPWFQTALAAGPSYAVSATSKGWGGLTSAWSAGTRCTRNVFGP